MKKSLYLVRGLPGSGKSTVAKSFGGAHYETDMYFMKDVEYVFDVAQIKKAHEWCRQSVENEMINETPIITVSNTFTQEWEMKPYFELAEKYDYIVFCIIVENRHNGINAHNVPEKILIKMKERFEIKL